MLQDAKQMFAVALAHNGSPSVVDLKNAKTGPGRRNMIQFNGNGLAGATGFKIVDGATSSPATDLASYNFSAAELNAGVTVSIPETVDRYVTIALLGTTSAGTFTAGIAMQEGQTNT